MFSLRNKLFLAFLLSSTLLVIGMLALFQWSFDRGFLHYINQLEKRRLETLAPVLESYYTQNGNWSALQQPGALRMLFRQLHQERREFRLDHDRQPPEPPRDEGLPPRPLEPDKDRRPGPPPLFILDAEHHPVLGSFQGARNSIIQPLKQNGQVIGYVGLYSKKVPQELVDRQFAASQSHNFIYIALIALAVSLLVAYPLASLLVKRIRLLLTHIRELGRGNYTHRIDLPGRDELNLVAAQLNDLGMALDKSVQSRRAMVADISHELRTPIAVLRAQLEAIEDGVQPCNDNTVRRMHEQTLRLSKLVNDLYELSLADIGALSYRKQALNLRQLIQAQVQSAGPQFQKAGLLLQTREDDQQPLMVLGDEQRLNQLFGNLLQNSLQYTNTPGRVEVSVRRDGTNVIVEVNDSAPGVDASIQPKLFERLFRADSSRNRDSGGAGLGLSLCQSIAEAHGGDISASDSPLGGLSISVRIPLVQS